MCMHCSLLNLIKLIYKQLYMCVCVCVCVCVLKCKLLIWLLSFGDLCCLFCLFSTNGVMLIKVWMWNWKWNLYCYFFILQVLCVSLYVFPFFVFGGFFFHLEPFFVCCVYFFWWMNSYWHLLLLMVSRAVPCIQTSAMRCRWCMTIVWDNHNVNIWAYDEKSGSQGTLALCVYTWQTTQCMIQGLT